MTNVAPISYLAVHWAVSQINHFLLKSGGGIVLRVTIDKHKNISGVDLVTVQEAMSGGFEPVNLVGKPEPPPLRAQ